MTSVCLYLKVHQAYRLKKYHPTDIAVNHCYEDAEADKAAIELAADTCYLPANEILYHSLKKYKGKFKTSFSISGTTLELLQQYRPDVIESFKKLVATGYVEILAETFYHSLSFLHSKKEFQRQVEKHSALVNEIFETEPAVFRNTELIYNNELACFISGLGFRGLLCEGVERILQGRSVNQLYAAPDNGDFGLLLRNTSLSDDIAYRFDDTNWSEHPLTAEIFAKWLHAYPENTDVINLFLDYETFGIHKKSESGIFDFLDALPGAALVNKNFQFLTPSDFLQENYPRDVYDVTKTISWEDRSNENCIWCENVMQNNTLKKIYSIGNMVLNSNCTKSIDIWGRLQAADHFYYMREETSEWDNSNYQNPFSCAKEAFQNYNNILIDFEISLIKNNISNTKQRNGLRLPSFNLY
jgi:alpha-amylase